MSESEVPETQGEILSTLRTLVDAINGPDGVRVRLDEEKQARKRSTTRVVAALVVLVIIAGVIGMAAWRNTTSVRAARDETAAAHAEAQRAAAALGEFVAQTGVARKSSCYQDRHRAFTQRKAEKDEERQRRATNPATAALTARFLEVLGITQAELDRITAAQLHDFDRVVDAAHPLRDCSPAGIAQFLGLDPP